ncbi:MAG: CvpA family protein [Bacteroidaceae bacterium]|jgi:membrane protein required for colicin V production|nr:CvpA family protein [Bacteroidaceae bacterium]
MQIVDIIMLGLVVLMTVWGMVRGIVRQIGDLAALILGVVGANLWGGSIATLLVERTEWSLLLCQILAYVGVFLSIYLTIRIVAGCIKSITQLVRLGWIDSIAGGLFGAFKTILFVSLLLNLTMLVTKDADVWTSPELTQSVCYETVKSFAPNVLHHVWQGQTTQTP